MEIVEDVEFARELTEAMIAAEDERPRNQQIQIGPSGVGGCLEYIRNVMIGTPGVRERGWKTAAWVGTIGGEAIEQVLAAKLGAKVQGASHARLPVTGIEIEGHYDACFVDRNTLVDLKSVDGFATIRSYGPKAEHVAQIATYVLGLVQDGTLTPGATGRLAYWDRSGKSREFMVITFQWEALMSTIEQVEEALLAVLRAQAVLEQTGDTELIHYLRRDYTGKAKLPSWCLAESVQCPFRFECWDKSDWMPNERIEDPEQLDAVKRYIEGRDMEKAGAEIREQARADLVDVVGMTPDGVMVAWTSNGKRLNVTEML